MQRGTITAPRPAGPPGPAGAGATATTAPPRHRSLDGLRGVAALVVLASHLCLVSPALTWAYLDPTFVPRGTAAWWASFSPAHLLWAGTEAVYVFFVLSGFVLALPFAGRARRVPGWAGYYPRRLVRLYLPVAAAVGLAALSMALVPRRFPADASLWLRAHVPALDAAAVRDDVLLVERPGTSITALWSLRFEVLFSLALPLVVWAGRRLPRLALAKAAALLAALFVFADDGVVAPAYLPMFGLGALMAFERERLRALGRAVDRPRCRRAAWAALTAGALLLVNSHWTVWGATTDPAELALLLPLARVLGVVGACLILFVAVEGPARWLESRPAQWLGSRSFSLYLVHEPIGVALAALLGGTPPVWASLAVAAPVALVVAEAFHRLVERPSHRLSRWVGARVDRRVRVEGRVDGRVRVDGGRRAAAAPVHPLPVSSGRGDPVHQALREPA